MFAIAFDLVVADTEKHHPKGVSQAYTDIAVTLAHYVLPSGRNASPSCSSSRFPSSDIAAYLGSAPRRSSVADWIDVVHKAEQIRHSEIAGRF
jgi:hypothetical protein